MWVYYSAQVFLFGAEFTAVYARSLGSLRGQAARPVAPQAIAARAKENQPVVAAAARKIESTRPVARSIGIAMLAGVASGALAKVLLGWRRRHRAQALATAPLDRG